jgi:hypothetical protein
LEHKNCKDPQYIIFSRSLFTSALLGQNILFRTFFTDTIITITLETTLYNGMHVTEAYLPSSLGSTAQLRPWPPPQNPAEFREGFSTIFFFTG